MLTGWSLGPKTIAEDIIPWPLTWTNSKWPYFQGNYKLPKIYKQGERTVKAIYNASLLLSYFAFIVQPIKVKKLLWKIKLPRVDWLIDKGKRQKQDIFPLWTGFNTLMKLGVPFIGFQWFQAESFLLLFFFSVNASQKIRIQPTKLTPQLKECPFCEYLLCYLFFQLCWTPFSFCGPVANSARHFQ